MTAIKPYGNRLLAKKYFKPKTTDTGLLLPESMQDKDKFIVIDVGTGFYTNINIGDIVYVSKYSGKEIVQDGEPFFILDEDDIIAMEYKESQEIGAT